MTSRFLVRVMTYAKGLIVSSRLANCAVLTVRQTALIGGEFTGELQLAIPLQEWVGAGSIQQANHFIAYRPRAKDVIACLHQRAAGIQNQRQIVRA